MQTKTEGARTKRWTVMAAAALTTAALVLGASVGTSGATARAPGAPSAYVDCAHGDDHASGTSASHPLRTLTRASATRLRPGSSVLFRRGTHCRGVFAPTSSGTKGRPIVAGAYGKGGRPILDGAGARAAIVLRDVQGWTIRDLAVRNPGPVTPVGLLRSAIQIDNDRLGVAAGFTIQDNLITDVATSRIAPEGSNAINYGKDSGGILLTATDDNAFAGVVIAGNRLERVGREGIVVRGGAPTTGLVIRANRLRQIQGDGIVAIRAAKALIERNVLDGFNTRGRISNAGMWAYHSTDVTFQLNVVSHGSNGDLDGSAFDIDGGNERLVFQYNLSHDNDGGFLMMCGDMGTQSGNSIVRYNVSQNDHLSDLGVIRAPLCGNEQNIQIYNNTIYTRDTSAGYLVRNTNGSSLVVTNNLFVAPPTKPALIEDVWSQWNANLYAGVSCKLGPAPDRKAVIADPGLVQAGKATSRDTASGYRLRKGSPALGKGTPVAGNGGKDFFGDKVPAGGRPNIGAYQGPGVAPQAKAGPKLTAPGCGA